MVDGDVLGWTKGENSEERQRERVVASCPASESILVNSTQLKALLGLCLICYVASMDYTIIMFFYFYIFHFIF